MIEELEWRKNGNDKEFSLFAYDGHQWFKVPYSIEYGPYSYKQESDASKTEGASKQDHDIKQLIEINQTLYTALKNLVEFFDGEMGIDLIDAKRALAKADGFEPESEEIKEHPLDEYIIEKYSPLERNHAESINALIDHVKNKNDFRETVAELKSIHNFIPGVDDLSKLGIRFNRLLTVFNKFLCEASEVKE